MDPDPETQEKNVFGSDLNNQTPTKRPGSGSETMEKKPSWLRELEQEDGFVTLDYTSSYRASRREGGGTQGSFTS